MTEVVALRPVVEQDLAFVEAMFGDPEVMGEFLWGGWSDVRVWRRRWEDNRLLDGTKHALVVTVDGEPAGMVSWRPIEEGTSFQFWEIGILLAPAARGHGHGSEAQRQLVRYLFANTPVNRVQALTDAENLAEQRALEKAGFVREGVMRGYSYFGGRWHDEVLYSVVRSDR
jgi:RimJ/RimL family protein N-acetyltransferase